MRSSILFLAIFLFLYQPDEAVSDTVKRIHYSTGTGFFVTKDGKVVTNFHVVETCPGEQIELRNDIFGWTPAHLLRVDKTHDLALLDAERYAPKVATLRVNNTTIRPGDPLVVIGYPEAHAETGRYLFVKSEVIDVQGPSGEPTWLQFTDVARQGNSGGPLLDQGGHVIGVVSGRAEKYRVNELNGRSDYLGTTSIAITLPVLEQFLSRHGIYYPRSQTIYDQTDRFVEKRAREYIVNVRCVVQEEIIEN